MARKRSGSAGPFIISQMGGPDVYGGNGGISPHRAAARQDRVAKNLFLLSNTQTKGSNSLVLLQYTKTDTTAKSLTTSRHYEVDTSGLLGMQRHCMSSQTFD